jgi:chloride channel, nucleotide-sensitive, 1A
MVLTNTIRDLILFQTSPTPVGVAIPYTSIALHATMKWQNRVNTLYMNVSLNDVEQVNDEDEIQVLEATIYPADPANHAQGSPDAIKKIFEAMNYCADLHSDLDDSDEEEATFDIPEPGANSWITADNMDDFVDEDGNFIGRGVLGRGAGNVRPRDDESGEINGLDGNSDESKWRRTE